MPSSSMYLGRISSPRLEILPLALEMLCNKNGGFFHKADGGYVMEVMEGMESVLSVCVSAEPFVGCSFCSS